MKLPTGWVRNPPKRKGFFPSYSHEAGVWMVRHCNHPTAHRPWYLTRDGQIEKPGPFTYLGHALACADLLARGLGEEAATAEAERLWLTDGPAARLDAKRGKA